MQTVTTSFREGSLQNTVRLYFPIGDCLIDAREILINDAARTEIEMTHLGIAHLAFR
jgi:hypothetical protein